MTINRKNFLIVWGIFLSAGLVWSIAYWNYLPHLPDTYAGEAINGKVVDADTGKPLAGAIVIGLYELSAPYSLEGSIVAGHIHVEEVLTDGYGNYLLAAWGPKSRYGDSYLNRDGPLIIIYKNGYQLSTNNNSFSDSRYNAIQTSFYKERTIELKRFEWGLDAYARHLSQIAVVLDSLLDPLFGARDCAWKAVPAIMLELDRLKQLTRPMGIDTSRIPDLEYLAAEGNCGTREDFIRRYKNEIKDDNQRTDSGRN